MSQAFILGSLQFEGKLVSIFVNTINPAPMVHLDHPHYTYADDGRFVCKDEHGAIVGVHEDRQAYHHQGM